MFFASLLATPEETAEHITHCVADVLSSGGFVLLPLLAHRLIGHLFIRRLEHLGMKISTRATNEYLTQI